MPAGRPTPIPLAVAVPQALVAGLATRLAFPDPGWWPLATVGLALWLAALAGRSRRAGAGLGLVYGLSFFVPLLHWSGIYVGALPWLALAAVQAGYLVLLGLLLPTVLMVRSDCGRTAAGAVGRLLLGWVGAAGLWVVQEALRSRTPFGGLPWGRLAFSQVDAPAAGLAALGGAPLVSFAVAFGAAALCSAALTLLSRSRASRHTRPAPPWTVAAALAGCLLAVLASTGGGVLVPRPTSGPTVRIAGVQGNVPSPGLDFNAERRAVLDNHVHATQALAADVRAGLVPPPDLVIWPENSSDIDPFEEPDARAVIDRATDAIGVPVLVGAVLQRPDDRATNASIVWTPSRGPAQLYAKRHPVPFAEYIPYRSFFRLLSSKVDLVSRDFVGGDVPGVLRLGPAVAGVVICFEVAHDDLVRDTVREGADLLVVQTNNATFGYSDEAVQQLAMSRLRAIEHGRSVAHVSTVGVSALIRPDGQVITSSTLFTQDVLQAALPLRTTRTVASRLGGWGELLLGALAAVAALGCLVIDRRARQIGSAAHTGHPATAGPRPTERTEAG